MAARIPTEQFNFLLKGAIMKRQQCNIIFLLVLTFFLVPRAFAGPNDLVNLGQAIYNDLELSLNQNQSCMTCHHPSSGFADPENRVSPALLPVSDGSDPTLFGGRNAPSASYAGFSPIFHYDPVKGLFVGGLFWDGRATGRMDLTATEGMGDGPTGDPLADQAKGPFGNPVEMALTDSSDGTVLTEDQVVAIIQASDYAAKFKRVFGPNAFKDVMVAYNNASLAIAAFERSKKLNPFKSKFDKFVKEQGGDVRNFGVEINPNGFRQYVGPPAGFRSKVYCYDEADGLAIFNADSYTQKVVSPSGMNGGQCYLCHLTENHRVVADDPTRPVNGPEPGIYNPILTDFTYDNLGIPVNPRIAELAGPQSIDLGLGRADGFGQLDAAFGGTYPDADLEEGKFKVASLRNISRTAPYGHNGYFATLLDVVHFYNTRDVDTSWPAAEVPATVNGDELGDLGLTPAQERKLVLFMKTLND